MQLVLHLNARFQPKHRFELEDALQEIFQKNKTGEITGGGTSLRENGEIDSCDIEMEKFGMACKLARRYRHSERVPLTRSGTAGSCRHIRRPGNLYEWVGFAGRNIQKL